MQLQVCSYCFNYGKGKNPPPSVPFSTLEQLQTAVDNIASLNRPRYSITLSGGEPTLHPHFFDVINLLHEKLNERLNWIRVISNGSRNVRFYKKIADVSKSVNMLLKISIHTDHVDMRHILELIENLSEDLHLHFAVMFNPDKREEVHLMYDILFEYRKRFPFTMEITPLRDGDRVDPRHTQEDLTWQKKSALKFLALENALASKVPLPTKQERFQRVFYDIEYNGERKLLELENVYSDERYFNYTTGLLLLKGIYCIAHAAVLRINEGGLCRGMVCGADPCICNIYEKDSLRAVRDKLIHAIQCPKKMCGCGNNDLIPKFAFLEEAIRFMEVIDAKQQALFAEYEAAHSIKTI